MQGAMGMASMLAGCVKEHVTLVSYCCGTAAGTGTMPDAAAQRCVVAAELASACADAGIAPQLLVVTAGASDLVPGRRLHQWMMPLWGFGRSLMNRFPTTSGAPANWPTTARRARPVRLINEVLAPDAEDN